MNILFLIFHGFSETSGITKKIKAQVEGLRQNGHTVYVCTYTILENGHRCRMVDDEVLQDYGTGKLAALRKRTCYKAIFEFCQSKKIEAVYCRSFHNANPWTIKLFKRFRKAGVNTVMEIPTYPYDQEYIGFPLFTRLELFVDKLFRHKLARNIGRIVTFSSDEEIFGQKTIRISNGISFEKNPLRKPGNKMPNNEDLSCTATSITENGNAASNQPTDAKPINLIGVAEVHYWHGFDRIISGLGEYYKNGGKRNITFHIIGGVGPSEMHGSQHAPGFKELIDKYNIAKHVKFHGAMYGEELNHYFDICDFAIGSLGRHRSGITDIKTLKNREYAARGIPFIYSEHDSDFEDKNYVVKAPADESPIKMQEIMDFIEGNNFEPENIRCSIKELSWQHQMSLVFGNSQN